ncbi:MAG TPA: hypothetical protein DCR24_06175 [Bacillus bacterium]|nr:hypothetical protein [Bacillus sp. (in: firmicutes)]
MLLFVPSNIRILIGIVDFSKSLTNCECNHPIRSRSQFFLLIEKATKFKKKALDKIRIDKLPKYKNACSLKFRNGRFPFFS